MTTKGYVCCRPGSRCPDHRGCVDHEDVSRSKLGEVLATRICWALPLTWHNAEQFTLSRGRWAGHCFDIIKMQGKTGVTEEGSQDIAFAVVKEARGPVSKIDSRELTCKRLKALLLR